jgi:hypothetical protein
VVRTPCWVGGDEKETESNAAARRGRAVNPREEVVPDGPVGLCGNVFVNVGEDGGILTITHKHSPSIDSGAVTSLIGSLTLCPIDCHRYEEDPELNLPPLLCPHQ